MDSRIEQYLRDWDLRVDGDAFVTDSSLLVPVLADGTPTMLKVATVAEERAGNQLMVWWDGCGAARVLRHDDDAVLLERATGTRNLEAMTATAAGDEEATRILSRAVATLHEAPAQRPASPPALVPLREWFAELFANAERLGPGYREAALHAAALMAEPASVVLHGDIHHGNVLDFGTGRDEDTDTLGRGWLAIDPKGLRGHRAFDYANLLCNPSVEVALARLARRVEIVVAESGLAREAVLGACIAWTGLSAAWFAQDGDADAASGRLAIGAEAARLLHS